MKRKAGNAKGKEKEAKTNAKRVHKQNSSLVRAGKRTATASLAIDEDEDEDEHNDVPLDRPIVSSRTSKRPKHRGEGEDNSLNANTPLPLPVRSLSCDRS
jgi:hypothetical protein